METKTIINCPKCGNNFTTDSETGEVCKCPNCNINIIVI